MRKTAPCPTSSTTPHSDENSAAADGPTRADLRAAVAGFQSPSLPRSLGQIASSFGGFAVTCAAMYFALGISYWIVLALSVVAAGFVVRIFIIQHDCGHGAFFRSRRANDVVGKLCSVFTFTPYATWRRQHAGHHGIWNDLDRRLSGADIYSSCLTVAEYQALSVWQRRWYRLGRNPIVSNIIVPPIVFFLLFRVPFDAPKSWRSERRGVYLTNLALITIYGGLGFLLGFVEMVAVQVPIMVVASIVGVWLFSVQHRFERTLWARNDDWRFADAALQGSSHLRMPKLLQWFTGNIGLHHVHHLSPRIPNYRLQACHDANAIVRTAPTLTLWRGIGEWKFALWDENRKRMVPFKTAAHAT